MKGFRAPVAAASRSRTPLIARLTMPCQRVEVGMSIIPGVFSLQDTWLISVIGWTEARNPIEWRGRPNLEAPPCTNASRQLYRRPLFV
jgi:hypothetical protein